VSGPLGAGGVGADFLAFQNTYRQSNTCRWRLNAVANTPAYLANLTIRKVGANSLQELAGNLHGNIGGSSLRSPKASYPFVDNQERRERWGNSF
jgi:hypothetical protein